MVEFDDGDTGHIAVSNIRLLPPDFKIQCEWDGTECCGLEGLGREGSTASLDPRSAHRHRAIPRAAGLQLMPEDKAILW